MTRFEVENGPRGWRVYIEEGRRTTVLTVDEFRKTCSEFAAAEQMLYETMGDQIANSPEVKSGALTFRAFLDPGRKPLPGAPGRVFNVTWSEEDHEYVATCPDFPYLSWLDKVPGEALKEIMRMVEQVEEEIQRDLSQQTEHPPLTAAEFMDDTKRAFDVAGHTGRVLSLLYEFSCNPMNGGSLAFSIASICGATRLDTEQAMEVAKALVRQGMAEEPVPGKFRITRRGLIQAQALPSPADAMTITLTELMRWRKEPPIAAEVREHPWWWNRMPDGTCHVLHLDVRIGSDVILDVEESAAHDCGGRFDPEAWPGEWAVCLPPGGKP